jgi:hypothetical protein
MQEYKQAKMQGIIMFGGLIKDGRGKATVVLDLCVATCGLAGENGFHGLILTGPGRCSVRRCSARPLLRSFHTMKYTPYYQ